MAPKDQWGYIGNNGPNKETLLGRLLSRETVSFTFERWVKRQDPETGHVVEVATFPFRILGVDHHTHGKTPEEVMPMVFHVKDHELWRVRGFVRVGSKNRDPHSWVYVELKYTTFTRHADFLRGLDDLKARKEFTDAFKRRNQR